MDAGMGIGPIELLIVGGCCLVLPAIVVIAIISTKSKRPRRDE